MENDKEIILGNIRNALGRGRNRAENNGRLDEIIDEKLKSITPSDLSLQFKSELEQIDGEVIFIEEDQDIIKELTKIFKENSIIEIAVSDDEEVMNIAARLKDVKVTAASSFSYPLRKSEISKIDVSLVFGGAAIADLGSVVFFYDKSKTSYPHFLCDWTIVLLKESAVFANQFDFFKNNKSDLYKNMVFVSGPSRTADIEKTLVLGAHGPRKVTVLLLKNK